MENQMEDVRLIVYTDNPEIFKIYLSDLPIEYSLLTPVILEDMLAGTDFIHRRKVAVIDLTFRNFPNEDLVFMDSDTFCMNDPKPLLDRLSTGVSLLHKREYNLKDGLALFSLFGQGQYPEAFIDYLSDREFFILGKPETFSIQDYSWNSGVIGLNKQFRKYMPDIFAMTDDFFAHSHWFVSEQMAFSLILQRKTHIVAAENVIVHYWGARQKVLVDSTIMKWFRQYTLKDLRNGKCMRPLTRKMQYLIDCDLIYEQLEIAVLQRNFIYSAKKAVQLVFLKMFKVKIRKPRKISSDQNLFKTPAI